MMIEEDEMRRKTELRLSRPPLGDFGLDSTLLPLEPSFAPDTMLP